MKILGFEIKRVKPEQRGITVGPSTSVGLPYGGFQSTLSNELAMKLSAVYRCVDVVSDSIATTPINILEFKNKEEWVRNEFHWANKLLNIEPNPSISKYNFMKTIASMVLLNGNAYAQIVRDEVGNPTRLLLLNGEVTMYLRDDWSVYYGYIDSYSSREFRIPGEDMIHIPNFSYDGLLGVSTLTHAANITSLATSADGQAKGYYLSGVNMNGVISVPGKISADAAKALKNSWKDAVGYNSSTGQGGGVVVIEGGAEYKTVQVNPKDAQMLETRQFNVVDICRFFGVHPSKAFDQTGNTYSNVENYNLGYITDTIVPFARKIENEFNRKLFRPSQRTKTKIVLDTDELIAADMNSRADYFLKMIQCGAYSPNDISRKVRSSTTPGGDKRYVQANMVPIDRLAEPEQNKNTGIDNISTT